MIEEVIRYQLTNTAGVTAINGSENVYANVLRTAVIPNTYIIFTQISALHEASIDLQTDQVKQERWQVDVYAKTYTNVVNLSDAVIDALHKLQGDINGNNLELCMLDSSQEIYEDKNELFRKSLDFLFYY